MRPMDWFVLSSIALFSLSSNLLAFDTAPTSIGCLMNYCVEGGGGTEPCRQSDEYEFKLEKQRGDEGKYTLQYVLNGMADVVATDLRCKFNEENPYEFNCESAGVENCVWTSLRNKYVIDLHNDSACSSNANSIKYRQFVRIGDQCGMSF